MCRKGLSKKQKCLKAWRDTLAEWSRRRPDKAARVRIAQASTRMGWFLAEWSLFRWKFFALSWVQSQSSPLGQILWAPAHSMSKLVPKATTKKNGPQNHLTPSPRARPISKVPDLNGAIVSVLTSLKRATWPPSPRVRPIRNWMWKVSWLKWSFEF